MAGTQTSDGKHVDLTSDIIGAFYKVHATLGYGFPERVYENALAIELRKLGLRAEQQRPIKVLYDGAIVGDYVADLVVEDVVLVELKSVERLLPEHLAQLLNYLKATTIEVGLLLNFGPRPQVKPRVFDNARKGPLTWVRRR